MYFQSRLIYLIHPRCVKVWISSINQIFLTPVGYMCSCITVMRVLVRFTSVSSVIIEQKKEMGVFLQTSNAASDSSSDACSSSFSISIFFFVFWSSWTLFPPSDSWSVRSVISSETQHGSIKHCTTMQNYSLVRVFGEFWIIILSVHYWVSMFLLDSTNYALNAAAIQTKPIMTDGDCRWLGSTVICVWVLFYLHKRFEIKDIPNAVMWQTCQRYPVRPCVPCGEPRSAPRTPRSWFWAWRALRRVVCSLSDSSPPPTAAPHTSASSRSAACPASAASYPELRPHCSPAGGSHYESVNLACAEVLVKAWRS